MRTGRRRLTPTSAIVAGKAYTHFLRLRICATPEALAPAFKQARHSADLEFIRREPLFDFQRTSGVAASSLRRNRENLRQNPGPP